MKIAIGLMLACNIAACIAQDPIEAESDVTSQAAQALDPGTSSPSQEASPASREALTAASGTCTPSVENGGHTAVEKCTGFLNTGTFRVVTTCCLSHCDNGETKGPLAFLAGGTSRVGCGSAFATNIHIELGPAGG